MVKTKESKAKVLIVDDEEDICFFLSYNLSKRGFSTSVSHNLSEASKQLEINKPGILFLDNHLPDGKGVDFLTRITSKYPAMKIIMISAHDSPQDKSKAYSNGVSFFLPKPFTMTEINQVVDLVTDKG